MEANYGDMTLEFDTDPLGFAPAHLDRGTRALLNRVQLKAGSRILDLGCGVGVIGVYLAKKDPQADVTMVDQDAKNVALAKDNAEKNGVTTRIVQSVGTAAIPQLKFDAVVSHPHSTLTPESAKQVAEGAYRQLVEGGNLYLVSKDRSDYEARLKSIFGNLTVTESDGYFIFYAEKRPRKDQDKPGTHSLPKKQQRQGGRTPR